MIIIIERIPQKNIDKWEKCLYDKKAFGYTDDVHKITEVQSWKDIQGYLLRFLKAGSNYL